MQRIVSIDSTILNSIQLCPQRTYYSHVLNIGHEDPGESIEKGDLMHKMLEVYYGLVGACLTTESALAVLRDQLGIMPEPQKYNKDEASVIALEAGNWYQTQMHFDPGEAEEVIYQFTEYHKHYSDDGWSPLAVEEVASKVLFEDSALKIIYNGKIDLFAEKGNLQLPWDHKTQKRRSDPSSQSNQFKGYCYLMGCNNILVNRIGFQESLKPQDRFLRDILTIPQSVIEEWKQDTVWWVRMLLYHLDTNHWPQNQTSCDKYNKNCLYKDLCTSDPAGRDWKIERDYQKRPAWDVAQILEASK